MEYKRFGDKIVVRIDRGEEILSSLRAMAEAESVKLASVSAIGAVGSFTVGAYLIDEQRYVSNDFSGNYEIVSLTGNINTMNGAYYAHLHMSAANDRGEVFGGHLNRAVISATCEMVVTVIDGEVDRFHDEKTGLNLLRF